MKLKIFTIALFTGIYSLYAQPKWSTVFTSAGTDGTNSFAVSGSVIIAGTSRNNTPLVISTDGGVSWSNTSLLGVSGSATSTQIYAMAVTTMGGITTWYAGTYGTGIFTSTNSGSTWAGPIGSINQTNGLFVKGDTVYAASNGALYISTTAGASWDYVTGSNSMGALKSVAVIGTNIFVAAGYSGNTASGIYMATALGSAFTNVSNPSGAFTTHGSAVLFAYDNTTLLAGTDNGTLLSTNSGANWAMVSSTPTHAFANIGNNRIVAGSGFSKSIVMTTNTGVTWTNINTGLPASYFGALIFTNNILLAGPNSNNSLYGTPLVNDFSLSTTAATLTGTASLSVSVSGAFLNTGFTETASNSALVSVSTMPGNVFELAGMNTVGIAVVSVTGDNSFFDMPKTSIVSLITLDASTPVTTVPTTTVGTNTLTGIGKAIASVEASAYPNPFESSFVLEGAADFAIYDAQGQKVSVNAIALTDDKKRITLSNTGIFYLVTPGKTLKIVSQ